MARRWEVTICAVILAASIAAAFAIGTSAATGLVGTFWPNAEWSGPPIKEQPSSLPDIAHFIRGVPRVAATGGSAEWTGVVFVDQSGEYEFEVSSDGRAWLFVGGRSVVDNGDGVVRRAARGRVALTPGAHAIRIRYVQRAASGALDVFMSGPGLERHLLRAEELAPYETSSGSASRRRLVRMAALAVPIAWALLMIYVIGRLAGHWLWREVMRVAPSAADRRPLVVVLVCGFGLTVWGLTWGLDSSWAPDELLAGHVRELIQRRFADGWYDKYPVMHYAILGIPVSAFEIASRIGLLSADSLASNMAQLAMMRAVSVVMGLGTLIAAFLCAAELYGPRRATLASWSLLLTGVFVYYGKTANLEMAVAWWFGLAVLGFIRIWTRNRTADYVLLGVAAAATVATKDQAYANLALLPIGVIAANVTRDRRFFQALVNRRMLLGGAAALVAFALFHNSVFNFRGVVDHFRLLWTLNDLHAVPRTARGYAELTVLTGGMFRLLLGWPLLLAALAGVAAAAWNRERRWWLWLLLVPVSFHLTFTFVTLYAHDRFLFGGVFVAALFAGSMLADLLDQVRMRLAGRVVVAGILGYSLLSAASVNAMMDVEARNTTRKWVEDRANEGDRVGLIGWYMPTLGPSVRPVGLEATRMAVTASMPEWLMLNGRFASRYAYDRSPLGRELMAGLADGSLGYEEVFRYRAPVPAWAILQYDEQFRRSRESSWTNLDKINPEMMVYRRR